jgi:hypothetical protein
MLSKMSGASIPPPIDYVQRPAPGTASENVSGEGTSATSVNRTNSPLPASIQEDLRTDAPCGVVPNLVLFARGTAQAVLKYRGCRETRHILSDLRAVAGYEHYPGVGDLLQALLKNANLLSKVPATAEAEVHQLDAKLAEAFHRAGMRNSAENQAAAHPSKSPLAPRLPFQAKPLGPHEIPLPPSPSLVGSNDIIELGSFSFAIVIYGQTHSISHLYGDHSNEENNERGERILKSQQKILFGLLQQKPRHLISEYHELGDNDEWHKNFHGESLSKSAKAVIALLFHDLGTTFKAPIAPMQRTILIKVGAGMIYETLFDNVHIYAHCKGKTKLEAKAIMNECLKLREKYKLDEKGEFPTPEDKKIYDDACARKHSLNKKRESECVQICSSVDKKYPNESKALLIGKNHVPETKRRFASAIPPVPMNDYFDRGIDPGIEDCALLLG